MQTKTIVGLIAIFMIAANIVSAQTITPEQYIAQYKDIAIREMRRMGVPAAITLAQGLLETENGNSDLVKKSNNHFGIKCKDTWTANGVTHDDDELGECFRKYNTAEESYRDHSNFLRSRDRYGFLFKLSPLDYKGWAYGLKKAGYATNVKYPQILINNIEQYNLQQYSEVAADDVPKIDASKYTDDSETTIDAAPSDVASVNDVVIISQDVFLINGIKCINAQKGASLLAIATKNNIDLGRLLMFNDMGKDGILPKGQLIFLQKKSVEGDKPFYIIQQDENLYDVAQKNGIQLNSLLVYNQLEASAKVYPGTKLYLRQLKTVAAIKPLNEQAATSKQYHDVQPKEGLYSISKKYGVSMGKIKEWNNLDSDQLHVGQQLVIYK